MCSFCTQMSARRWHVHVERCRLHVGLLAASIRGHLGAAAFGARVVETSARTTGGRCSSGSRGEAHSHQRLQTRLDPPQRAGWSASWMELCNVKMMKMVMFKLCMPVCPSSMFPDCRRIWFAYRRGRHFHGCFETPHFVSCPDMHISSFKGLVRVMCRRAPGGVLHCVDNFAHQHTTAPELFRVAQRQLLRQFNQV